MPIKVTSDSSAVIDIALPEHFVTERFSVRVVSEGKLGVSYYVYSAGRKRGELHVMRPIFFLQCSDDDAAEIMAGINPTGDRAVKWVHDNGEPTRPIVLPRKRKKK